METSCCGCFHTPTVSRRKRDKLGTVVKPEKKVLNFSSVENTRNGSQIYETHKESRTMNELKASTQIKDNKNKS